MGTRSQYLAYLRREGFKREFPDIPRYVRTEGSHRIMVYIEESYDFDGEPFEPMGHVEVWLMDKGEPLGALKGSGQVDFTNDYERIEAIKDCIQEVGNGP